jgi:biotin operon repressor
MCPEVIRMPYERTRKIGERFEQTVRLIKKGSHNARQLSQVLGVSRPTVHRIIVDLRRRGYAIRAVRDGKGWHYELVGKKSAKTPGRRIKGQNQKRRIDKKNAR